MRTFLFACLCLTSCISFGRAPNVVVSIKPIHSLVANITGDVTTPILLLETQHSPHTFSLKPSDRKHIAQADLLIWVDTSIEPFMRAASTRPETAQLHLLSLPSLVTHRFIANGHNAHYAGLDPHIWLSPENAKVIAKAVAQRLSEQDPAHAPQYNQNLQKLLENLDSMAANIKQQLKPLSGVPFMVYHPAYQYFEKYFDLHNQGVLHLNPEIPLSAKNVLRLRQQIKNKKIHCLLTEPQFPDKQAHQLLEGLYVKTVLTDPIGFELKPGAALYFKLMHALGDSLEQCLMLPQADDNTQP